jgi:aerobic-type carbon monoxide dehydrogenase small subunit (CoxS/CutS family)
MDRCVPVSVTVNDERIERRVEARTHLVDFLRAELGLTSAHVGCEHGVCGACTVRVNGEIVRGCLVLAVQLADARVETIEHLSATGEIADLQRAFYERNAVQCGYCTVGMLMTAAELVRTRPDADRVAIRQYLSGNYCRCTGYQAIVDAVEAVLKQRKEALSP